jgi:hypothetical protein
LATPGDRQAEQRGFWPIHLDGQVFGSPFIAADAGVPHLGHPVHHVLGLLRGALRRLQIVAENLERDARVAAAEQAVRLLVAARGAGGG